MTLDDRFHIDTLDLYSARSRKALVREVALAFDQPYELIQSDTLRHKVLAIEEADYAVRSLISSDEIAIESVIRDRGTGAWRECR